MPLCTASWGSVYLELTVAQVDAAGELGVGAEDGAHGLGAAGADEAGDAKQFALAEREAHRRTGALGAQVLDAEDLLARGHAAVERVLFAHLLADHHAHDVVHRHGGHAAGCRPCGRCAGP